MPYTNNYAAAQMLHGPYDVLLGADGSEQSLGETLDLAYSPGLSVAEIKAGDLGGRETLLDLVINGVNPKASFILRQTKTADLYRAFPYLTYSTGPTKRSLTLNMLTHGGLSLASFAARLRFHLKGTADYTDKTDDKIFDKAILLPADDENSIAGQEGDGVAIVVYGLPDTAAAPALGNKLVWGVNTA